MVNTPVLNKPIKQQQKSYTGLLKSTVFSLIGIDDKVAKTVMPVFIKILISGILICSTLFLAKKPDWIAGAILGLITGFCNFLFLSKNLYCLSSTKNDNLIKNKTENDASSTDIKTDGKAKQIINAYFIRYIILVMLFVIVSANKYLNIISFTCALVFVQGVLYIEYLISTKKVLKSSHRK